MNNDEYYMNIAINLAQKAFECDEIPVGAVIVKDNEIIAMAHNKKDSTKLVTQHAELIVIEEANRILKDWRLNDCKIYVTMEPCPMCASAIQQSRIKELIYGCSSNIDENRKIIKKILQNSKYNHQVLIKKGILKNECSSLLKLFFKNKR